MADTVAEAAQLILTASISVMACPCASWGRPCAYHLGMEQGLQALVEWAEERRVAVSD